MIKNYFKIAFRNIQRNMAFSVINNFGLAIGIACCIILALIIHHELSFDLFHENASTLQVLKPVFIQGEAYLVSFQTLNAAGINAANALK